MPGETLALIADFDRTVARLFDDDTIHRMAAALRGVYSCEGVDLDAARAVRDPYALWSRVYFWMSEHYEENRKRHVHALATRELAGWERLAARRATLLPGVRDTLLWFRRRGVRCAIVSANCQDAVMDALETHDLLQFVDEVRGRRDGESLEDLKPNPRPLQQCLAVLGCSRHRAVYVGDSREDARAAKGAGVISIGVLTGQCSPTDLIEAGAGCIVPHFAAIRPVWEALELRWSGRERRETMEKRVRAWRS